MVLGAAGRAVERLSNPCGGIPSSDGVGSSSAMTARDDRPMRYALPVARVVAIDLTAYSSRFPHERDFVAIAE